MNLTIKIFFLLLINLQISQASTIINTGSENLHFSYETQFGEIKSIFIENERSYELKHMDNEKIRITFERNGFLFPVIISSNEVIYVKRISNYYEINQASKTNIVYQSLSDKKKILMSPFSGINYTKYTNYETIINEINRFWNERVSILDSADFLNRADYETIKLLIDFRKVDELLSPFNDNNVRDFKVSDSYQFHIDSVLNNLKSIKISQENYNLIKQYHWTIVNYKLFKKSNDLNTSELIKIIDDLILPEETRNFIFWKLYKKYENIDSLKIYFENYFASQCINKDYINWINKFKFQN
jgi:hypothetical protein